MTLASDDHIFSNYLGGTETVPACVSCNSKFGHTFEARTAKNFIPITTILQTAGLQLKQPPRIWRSALKHEGQDYDLTATDSGVRINLTRPKIEFDDQGQIKSGDFRDKEQFDAFLKDFRKKNPEAEFELDQIPPPDFGSGLEYPIFIDPDLRRQALKMSIAAAAKFGIAEQIDNMLLEALAVSADSVGQHWECMDVVAAYGDYPELDELHAPLDHLIYIEANERAMYSVVRFFGALQIYCLLRTGPVKHMPQAFAATLDPITGGEKFSSCKAGNLAAPPDAIYADEIRGHLHRIIQKIHLATKLRGGTRLLDKKLIDGGFIP